jgi:polyhydroxyalkanoate synthesis repressor PhaR
MTDEQTETASEPSEAAREPKIIKRYTNRKLYDTFESRYVTLDEIAEMIKAGAEVKIVDNRTKEDLTSITLAQIIFEEEKKTSKMSLQMLRELIRHGGEMAQQFVEDTQARVEAVRQTILTRGQQTTDRAKELVQASQDAVVGLQRRVDERVRAAVEGMSNLTEVRRQLEEIGRRIDGLEKKLDEISKR